MRLILFFLAIVLLSPALFSQKDKDIPAWGKIDKADLEMKECDFDKEAEALVLFDVGELSLDESTGSVELIRRIRIKILKEKGFDKANIHLPYHAYRNDENIFKLNAQTYNLAADGTIKITEIEKKSIFDKKLNNRYSEKIFSFPEVKIGSVIEYKFTHSGVGLATWYFQNSIPVKFSRFVTDFITDVELSSTPFCVLKYESKYDTKGNRNVNTFSMTNVPALRNEPFISNEGDYLERIETRLVAINTQLRRVSYIRSWPGIIKQLMEDDDFGVQLKKNIPRTADLDAELMKVTDPYVRMKTIHHYVRKNMVWNGYTSIWAFEGVKSAWKDKKGTSGEINLILVNLLKDAGLDAFPVLVSTRDNGRVVTMIPGFGQFNKVLAYVKIGEKRYVLDATEKTTPTHLIPSEVMYTEGLVIEKLETSEWGWQTLWDENMLKKKMVILKMDITESDSIKGDAYINSIDYDRLERQPALKEGKDKLLSKYFTTPYPSIKVESFELENEDNDSLPLVQKLKFSQPVSSTGDYKFFTVNMFTGLEKNPFVADSRFSDIFFGTNQSYIIIANVNIPDGYNFEELPKNIRMIMPDTSITVTRRVAAEKNMVSVRINLDFKKPFYSTAEYDYFMAFYKKLFDLINEPILYRKKAIPNPLP
ncbi:MAG: DUF3857 domain-containing protein [Chitinophagaceae bacterium]